LVQSPVFNEALSFAIEHYKKHGDSSFIGILFGLYIHPTTRRKLTDHIRIHTGLHCSIEGGKVTFAKAAEEERVAFPVRPASQNQAKPAVKVKKKKRKAPKRVDALDAWARLPGNFGSGKRR
jgi:hypothetical protein